MRQSTYSNNIFNDQLKNSLETQLGFRTTTNLQADELFSSGVLDMSKYNQVQTHILSNTDGTIQLYFYADALGTDLARQLNIPYIGGSGFQLFSAPCFTPYVKYDFQNSSTNQTDFYYETKFLTTALSAQILGVESFISPSMTSALDRSVIVARNTAGVYQNINSDYNGDLRVSIGANNRTGFGELSVANLTPDVQEMFNYNINPRLINTSVTGGGTVSQVNSTAKISTSTTTSSIAELQTRKKARYRPGQGLLGRFTLGFDTNIANTEQFGGIIDDEDGFAFGFNGTSFGILHRNSSSGVLIDTWISQASWNRDPADGSKTLPNLDHTKLNVYQVQLQYLGAGAIKFYMENPDSGDFILVHIIEYANTYIQASLSNPTLPFSIYADNKLTTTDLVVRSASCGIFVEGMEKKSGFLTDVTNSKTGIGSTETNIITIQNREIYNSVNNKNLIFPYILNISTISFTKPVTISLRLNATLGGTPAYTNVDTNNSILAYDVAGTTVTNGTKLLSTNLSKEDTSTIDLKKFPEIFLQPTDTLTISASTPSGSGEAFVSITCLEDL